MADEESTEEAAAAAVSEVASESTLVVIARAASIVLGTLVTVVLGRYYGPEALGRYSLVRTLVFVTTIGTVFGFHQGLAKYLPRVRNEGAAGKVAVLTRTAASYTTFFALVATVLLVAGHGVLAEQVFDDPGMKRALLLGAMIVVPFTAVRTFSGLYRGLKAFGPYAVVKQAGLRMVLVLGLVGAWALGWNGAGGAVGAYLLATVGVVAWCVWHAGRFDLDFSPIIAADTDRGRELQREVLGFSSTMIFVAAMTFLMRKVDILMAGVFLDASRVGIYRIAATVSAFVAFFVKASNTIFSAIISELFAAGRRELLQRTYSSITKWIVVFTLPVVVSFWAYPADIVGFFGAEFTDGALTLQILSLGTFFSAAVGATGYLLIMGEYEGLQLVNNTFVAALNVALNWWLIPAWGIVGAATATAISFGTIAVLRVVELHLLLDLFPYDSTFLPIPVAAAAMGVVAVGARPLVGGVPMVLVVTAVNLTLGVAVMYWCRTELDRRLFGRVRSRVESLFYEKT